jgi:hypothetical protein
MLKKIFAPTMLNIGSCVTFVAFPLLHAAAFGGSPGRLVLGMVLMACSMFAPFLARACKQ